MAQEEPPVSNRLSTSSFPAWPNAHRAHKSDSDTPDLLDSDVKFMRIEGKLMERVTTGSESVRAHSHRARLIMVRVQAFCVVAEASWRSFCGAPPAAAPVFIILVAPHQEDLRSKTPKMIVQFVFVVAFTIQATLLMTCKNESGDALK